VESEVAYNATYIDAEGVYAPIDIFYPFLIHSGGNKGMVVGISFVIAAIYLIL
jgi:hypothetical protein